MGLDAVEILMKVEKTFGVEISGGEAEGIITVGNFHDAVWRQLSDRPGDQCNSQRLFYSLRRSMSEAYGLPKQQVLLDSSPDSLFPVHLRRQSYLQFATNTNLKLPDLVLPASWIAVLNIVGFLSMPGGLLLSLILLIFFTYSAWVFLIPVAGFLLTGTFSAILNPKRTQIKSKTIRDFTRETLVLNYATLAKESGTGRKEMESVMNHIIADHAGIGIEEIKTEKKIGDDLGID